MTIERKKMLKKLGMFLIFSSLVFSQELSLDEALIRVENNKNSYEYKKYMNKNEALKLTIKDNKLGDFNGINLSSTFNATENLIRTANSNKYSKTTQNRIEYGPFFISFNYLEHRNNFVSYGVEKNIKDIFFSPYKTNLRIAELQKNMNEVNYSYLIENKKNLLVDFYREVLDLKNEMRLKESAKKHYENEYKKIKRSFDLGYSTRIDLDAIDLEVQDLKLQIELIILKLKTAYETGERDFDINFSEYTLLDIRNENTNIEKYINTYMETDLKQAKLDLNIARENTKYQKYNSYMPDIRLGYERIDKTFYNNDYYKNQNVFTIKFSKKLFSTDSNYKQAKLSEESLENELEKKIKDIKNEREKLITEYDELRKAVDINDKKLDIADRKYKIKNAEYELGRISYVDVIDEYNTYLKQEIETKRIKNKLNAFIYKVIIKS